MTVEIARTPDVDDYLNERRIWWSWEEAQEYLRIKTGVTVPMKTLKNLGSRNKFKCGIKDGAPTLAAPVDRPSFMDWVHGRGGGRK